MGQILGYYVMPHPPIMLPEVGRGEEKKVQKTIDACYNIAQEIEKLKPEVIIIITPHGPMFKDAVAISNVPNIQGDLRRFGAPFVKFNCNVNMQLSDTIIRHAENYDVSAVDINHNSLKEYDAFCELDHGALVPLYHINKHYTDYEIVHITYGLLSKIELYKFGKAIKEAVEEDEFNAVIIASGDLSHRLSSSGPYEYSPYGREFDEKIVKLISEGDVEGIFTLDRKLIKEAGECGLRSFYIMFGAGDGYKLKGEVLSYEGPFGVGYGVIKLKAIEKNESLNLDKLIEWESRELVNKRNSEDVYVKLARHSLENFIRTGEYIDVPEYIPNELRTKSAGVFVSFKKDGELRGCIGTILPTTDSIANEIIRNAVEAGQYDPRFYPIEEEELSDLDISVDVLTKPKKASIEELDPKRFGVIVRKGRRTGLLLPDLEGIDTVEEQLRIALRKAGIGEDEDYEIEKFEVIRHGEK